VSYSIGIITIMNITNLQASQYQKSQQWYILIISIFFRKTRIIRSISDELEERIWYRPDNPCRAKKNTNIFFIGNFTIFNTALWFFCCVLTFFFNTNNFFIGNFTILTQLCDFFVVFWPFFLMKGLVTSR